GLHGEGPCSPATRDLQRVQLQRGHSSALDRLLDCECDRASDVQPAVRHSQRPHHRPGRASEVVGRKTDRHNPVEFTAPDSPFGWSAAAGIFVLALAVRLIHVWQIRNAPFFSVLMGDSRAYDEWAQQIALGDWLGRDVFYQAPLYPYFLGTLYAIAGRDLLLVRLAQAII